MKLRFPASACLLRIACVLALVALPLMTWSLFDPTVWPVLIALSLGQAIGTLSLLLFLIAVARDLHLAQTARRGAESAPPP